VIQSHVPKIVFGGLLILTISLKIAAGVHQPTRGQVETVSTQIAKFLTGQGFETDRGLVAEYPVTMSGRSGDCKLTIFRAAPEGWHQYVIRRLASDGDQAFFLFRGRKYQDQPIWLTGISSFWTSTIRKLGVKAPVEPVFGIVASPACNLDSMRWQELTEDVTAVQP
jgi:hypothetical protein